MAMFGTTRGDGGLSGKHVRGRATTALLILETYTMQKVVHREHRMFYTRAAAR